MRKNLIWLAVVVVLGIVVVALANKLAGANNKISIGTANLDFIKTLPGVKDAFILEGNDRVTELMPGIAIVATSTWAAFEAKKKLEVTWDESNASKDRDTNCGGELVIGSLR